MHFPKSQSIAKPKLLSLQAATLYMALFFVVAALSQLFAFEAYPDVLKGYGIPFISDFALPLAALVVTLEVFAVPALLWMKLSPLMRVVSIVSGWLVLAHWLFVGVWQSLADFPIPNAGLFGAKVHLPQGWWLVSYMSILLILMAYIAFGNRLPIIQKHRDSRSKS